MAATFNWLLGRHVVVSLTPLVMDANGNLVAGAVQSLVQQLEEVSISCEVQDENISPMDIRSAHHVIVEDDFSLNLVEILKANSTNILSWFFMNYDHAYVLATRGAQAWGMYLTRSNYEERLAKGKNTGNLAMKKVYISTGNPSYG